jgi:hypothetical protein
VQDIAIALGAPTVLDGGTDMPSASGKQLNLNFGGFETAGNTAAPSGATLATPFSH